MITLTDDYHLIRLVRSPEGCPRQFLYLVLNRAQANLALSRRKLTEMERELSQSGEESRLLKIECDYTLDSDQMRSKIESMIRDRENNSVSTNFLDEESLSFMNTDIALRLLGIDLDALQAHRPESPAFSEAIK